MRSSTRKTERSGLPRPTTLDGCTPLACHRPATSTACRVSPPGWRYWSRSVGAAGHGHRGLARSRPCRCRFCFLRDCATGLRYPPVCCLAALYVAMPNTREIHIVATNTQWHLALAALLVAFASSPRTWRGRVFDIAVLLVAAFSGPFCILLAPIVLLFWWLRRQPWSLLIFALVSLAACIQIGLLLHNTLRVHRRARGHA